MQQCKGGGVPALSLLPLDVQGVHEVFEGEPGKVWKEGEHHKSKMVFIGKNLHRDTLMAGLQGCLA